MPVNKYENPIAAEYINTYIPIPFQEMLEAGRMSQERYDKAASAVDELIDRVANIKTIPNSPDEIVNKKQVLDQIYKIRDEFSTKNLADPFVIRDLNSKLRTQIDRDLITKMENSFQNWSKAQEVKMNLAANGLWNKLLDQDPASLWDSKVGVYNYTPTAEINKAKILEPYYGNLKKEYLNVVHKDGYDFLVEGIDENKVRAVSERAAQELLDTEFGDQQLRLYKQAHPDEDLSSREKKTDALREIMYDYGKQFITTDYQQLSGTTRRVNTGGDFSTSGGNEMLFPAGAVQPNPGKNPRRVLRNVSKDIDAKRTSLSSLEKRLQSYEKNGDTKSSDYMAVKSNFDKIKSEVDKYDDIKNTAFDAAIKQFTPDINRIVEAISAEFPQFSDDEKDNAIKQQVRDAVMDEIENNNLDFIDRFLEDPILATNRVLLHYKKIKYTTNDGKIELKRIPIIPSVYNDLSSLKDEIRSKVKKELENAYVYNTVNNNSFAIPAKLTSGQELIAMPDGSSRISNTSRILKQFEGNPGNFSAYVQEKTDKGLKTLTPKGLINAFVNLERTTYNVNTNLNDDGSVSMEVSYKPKDGTGGSIRTFVLNLPVGYGQISGVAKDYEDIGDYNVAFRLRAQELSGLINQKIDSDEMQYYPIYSLDVDPNTKQAELNTNHVAIKREANKYVMYGDDNGSLVPVKSFNKKEEVKEYLLNLQAAKYHIPPVGL